MTNSGNRRKTQKQALRVPLAVKSGGLKVCPAKLERIMELANLAGDHQLPDIGFVDFRGLNTVPTVTHIPLAEYLPDQVRLNLLEVMTNPKAWEMTPKEWAAGFFNRWTAILHDTKLDLDVARGFLQAAALADRYALIRGSREALNAIVSGASIFPVTTFLKRSPDGKKAQYAGDPISDAIMEAELDYIKRCPICRKFFYAQRITQDACPGACANALRSRRKRASDKLKRELNKKAKKRGK